MASATSENYLFSRENRWFIPLLSELTVTNATHFGSLAILAVYLAENLRFSVYDTALILVCVSVGVRGSRIILAPFIGRIGARRILAVAITLSICGYIGMVFAHSVLAAVPCILLIGIGYGINSMLVTALASSTAQQSRAAFSMYALMLVSANIAAAVGPSLYNWLRLDIMAQAPFICSALILCGSMIIAWRIRIDIPYAYRDAQSRKAARGWLTSPYSWGSLAFIAIGWIIYAQKFAATPLFISTVLQRPEYVGLAVTLNALIGLIVSLPAGSFIRYHHISSRSVLTLCFLLYAAGYAVLSIHPTLHGLWCGVCLWSVGEALLMPRLNELVADTGFSLAAVAIGIGEAFGNGIGVVLLSESVKASNSWICYAMFSAVALLACAGAYLFRPAIPEVKKI